MILLKDENALRGELLENLELAVKDGRVRESRIDESVLRVWKLKEAHGLFENGGVVDVSRTEAVIEDPAFQTLSMEMSRTVRRTLRLQEGILPLTPDRSLLVIDPPPPDRNPDPRRLGSPRPWRAPGARSSLKLTPIDSVMQIGRAHV